MVEMLVMMIVAGIVFLLVTEGLEMFMRLQVRHIAAMERSGRLREGIYRIEALAGDADSVGRAGDGVVVHRNGPEAMLWLSDSTLIYRRAGFVDTLLVGAVRLQLAEYDDVPDTLEVMIRLQDGLTAARFGIRRDPLVEYEEEIKLIEDE